MKKAATLTLLAFLYFAVPSNAQVVRRPLLQRPLINQILTHQINLPLGSFFPGLPNLSIPPILTGGSSTDAKTYVSQAVVDNLAKTATNLRDTKTITDDLLTKNAKYLPAGTVTTTPRIVHTFTDDDLQFLKDKLK